jgi:hypothetical protein
MNDRIIVNGVYFVMRTKLTRRDLPKEFRSCSSLYTRFRHWCKSDRCSQMLVFLTIGTCRSLSGVVCTHIKAHQNTFNAASDAAAEEIRKTKDDMNIKLAAVVDGMR